MKKLNDILMQISRFMLIIMIPAMTIIVFAQVILRYVFLSPFSWIEELARYLLVWISCFGAAYAVRKGEHIAVLFLNNMFRGHAKAFVMLVIDALIIVFFATCLTKGIKLSLKQWNVVTPALGIPMTLPYMGIPIGFAIMLLFALEVFFRDTKTVFSRKALPKA
ncbi:MAG: TRAP transporter small permease [Deltaproteobacteria bacterium]|nr:TRAP transporter small permease [Deltaproteobacteria bacterium]